MNWKGVMPAIRTCFGHDSTVDYGFMARHCDHACSGIVLLCSLGDSPTLHHQENPPARL